MQQGCVISNTSKTEIDELNDFIKYRYEKNIVKKKKTSGEMLVNQKIKELNIEFEKFRIISKNAKINEYLLVQSLIEWGLAREKTTLNIYAQSSYGNFLGKNYEKPGLSGNNNEVESNLLIDVYDEVKFKKKPQLFNRKVVDFFRAYGDPLRRTMAHFEDADKFNNSKSCILYEWYLFDKSTNLFYVIFVGCDVHNANIYFIALKKSKFSYKIIPIR